MFYHLYYIYTLKRHHTLSQYNKKQKHEMKQGNTTTSTNLKYGIIRKSKKNNNIKSGNTVRNKIMKREIQVFTVKTILQGKHFSVALIQILFFLLSKWQPNGMIYYFLSSVFITRLQYLSAPKISTTFLSCQTFNI